MGVNGSNGHFKIYIDNTDAERTLSRMKVSASALKDEIAGIQAKGGDATKELRKLANTEAGIKALEKSISGGLTKSFRDLQSDVNRLQNAMKRATDPQVIAALEPQLKRAKQAMLEYQANVLKVESAQKQLASQSATVFSSIRNQALGLGDSIKSVFMGNFLLSGLMAVLGFLKGAILESIQWAMQVEGVRNAFNKIADPHILDGLRVATRGTVSDLELMKKAVMASNFGIPLEQLGTLLRFAQERARATGQSVDYLTESIVTGLARKSPLILDNLGINVQRINKEFSRTGDFTKAASKIIEEEMQKAGDYVQTTSDRWDRYMAKWSNLKTSMGTGIVDWITDNGLAWDVLVSDSDHQQEVIDKVKQFRYERSTEMQKFRDDELAALDLFKSKYAEKQQHGDDTLLKMAKESLSATEKMQKDAHEKGNYELATQLQYRIQLWNTYFHNLENKTKASAVNTLEGLTSEIDLLSKQLNTLQIGSTNFVKTQAEIKRLQKKLDDATGKTAEEQARKAKAEAEKNLRKQEEIAKKLSDLRVKVMGDTLEPYQRDILESQHRYDELKKQLIKYHIDTKELEELHSRDVGQILQKHFAELSQNYSKSHPLAVSELREKHRTTTMKDTGVAVVKMADILWDSAQRRNSDEVTTGRYALSRSNFNTQLKAQLALLEAERKQELLSTELTQAQRQEIEEKYRKARRQAEWDYYAKIVEIASQFINSILSVFQTLSEAQSTRENNELARDKAANDKKKESYQRQLDHKVISRSEYDRKVSALDAQYEMKERALKKRQFEREKTAKIIQANMQIAQSILQALSSAPPPYSFILAGLVAVAGAVQLATIKNTDAPEFGQGGRLRGPRHSDKSKGMPVTNPYTGEVQAYMEGDEGILKRSAMQSKKQFTVTGTPSQITSRLNAIHGGVNWDSGARVIPWVDYNPKPVNLPYVQSQIGVVKMYADGGQFTQNRQVPIGSDTGNLQEVLIQNIVVIQKLADVLNRPLSATLEFGQQEEQQKRVDAIRNNATFRA